MKVNREKRTNNEELLAWVSTKAPLSVLILIGAVGEAELNDALLHGAGLRHCWVIF